MLQFLILLLVRCPEFRHAQRDGRAAEQRDANRPDALRERALLRCRKRDRERRATCRYFLLLLLAFFAAALGFGAGVNVAALLPFFATEAAAF